MNRSKPNSPAGISRTTNPGYSRFAVRWSVSPHPNPLPWGEGDPCSPRRTIQTSQLSTTRCALFPLPAGEGQGEGNSAYELISRTGPFPGTVELDESSGGAGGFLK